jgi:hypothetical protein
MVRLSTLVVSLALALTAGAEDARLLSVFRHGTISKGVGIADMFAYDLDGDGRKELVSCAEDAPFAVSARGGTYVTSWHGPALGCTRVAVGDYDSDGGADVVTIHEKTVRIHDPRSLSAPVHTFTIQGAEYPNGLAIGNVDADAVHEIVVSTSSATHVYDGATLAMQWYAAGYGGFDVRLADVDGDTRREIIVSGSTAWVLDGGAQTFKWGYSGGFGAVWTTGNLDADAKDEIAFYAGTDMNILHGDTFQTAAWPVDWIDTVAIADGNGDGANEVITGNNQWGEIEGHAPAGGALLWHIVNPRHGTMTVGATDLDGDLTPEIWWGAGASDSGPDALFIGSAEKTAHEWRSDDLDGTFHSAVGDLDGDGRNEYVIASRSRDSGFYGGVIEIFDTVSGASKGTLSNFERVGDLAIGQLDADPALEIVVFADSYGATFQTWDGVTRELEFTSDSLQWNGAGLLVANIDADAVDELLFGTYDKKVVVLDGASNDVQKTFTLTSYPRHYALADMNGDQVRDLVLATDSLLAIYDTTSWNVLGSTGISDIRDMDAISAGGGTVAVVSQSAFSTYTGTALTFGRHCGQAEAVTFATFGDEVRLLVSYNSNVRVFPLSGTGCPASTPIFLPGGTSSSITPEDVDGDGRDELLIDSLASSAIALLGLSTELRGDADGDDVISEDDIDATVDYLFGTTRAMRPAGDVNEDGRIGIDDVFALIHDELAP